MSHTLLQCQNAHLSERDVHLISYDIHKCFDSLPWQAVRSSLLACGVGEPTADALFASWSNLKRIWKLQGRFQWASFRPSNGLFQGDPTAPACLAAFLAPPVQQVRQRWPQVSVSQYADDVLFASSDAHALRADARLLRLMALGTGVQLHASKCKWASTAADPVIPAFCVQRTRLQRTSILESLGGHFVLGSHPASPDTSVFPAGCLAGCRWDGSRSADIAALLPAITYSALAWNPAEDGGAARDARLLVNALSGNSRKENSRRWVEVSLALLSPVHRCSLREALLHEQAAILFRLLNTNAECRATVRRHFELCEACVTPPAESFFSNFQAAIAQFGWQWVAWDTLRDHRGQRHRMTATLLEDRRVEVRPHIVGAATADILPGVIADMAREHAAAVQEIRAPVLHLLREAMRDAAFHEASRRRRDMRGLADVDRDCFGTLWARVPKPEQPTLRFLMQGAAMTASRLHRSTRGRTSPTCPFCDHPWEDECHPYWVCPRWSPLRVDQLGAEHHEMSAELARLGTVAATCGIPTENITANLKSRWPDICSCMVAIHRAATPEGGDVLTEFATPVIRFCLLGLFTMEQDESPEQEQCRTLYNLRLTAGGAARIWSNARRRILLVKSEWAKYAKFQSVPDNAAAFRSVEEVWRPIMRRCGVPEGVVTALRSTWMSWRRDPTSPRRMHLRPFSSRWFGTSAADGPSGWQMFVGVHGTGGWDNRARDVGALMGGITYAAVSWDANVQTVTQDQRKVVDALPGGQVNTRRCLEFSLGLLAPVHRVSMPEAIVHEQLATLIRVLNASPTLREVVREHYEACSHETGVGQLAETTRAMSGPWWVIKQCRNIDARLGIVERDMCHVESAVRRLMAITHAALDAPDQAMALFLQQGAALAAARMRRSSRGRLSSLCPPCHAHDESECHRYWNVRHGVTCAVPYWERAGKILQGRWLMWPRCVPYPCWACHPVSASLAGNPKLYAADP
ncbi:unnamed protein product [Symbiodinium sp. KB8]|nr:unnamed protein product [Symbiodinium sp. KB8]